MTISINTLKDDINRAFRVLGADKGLQQNSIDILQWKEHGFISDEEYKELRKYNREQYSKLPLDA